MSLRKVQIVCTIGPASRTPKCLKGLIDAGMRVARINAAHGNADEHRETVERVREASARARRPVAVLLDLPGPKLRLGRLAEEGVHLRNGETIVLDTTLEEGAAPRLPLPDEWLAREVKPGLPVIIGDGSVELEIESVDGSSIQCRVIVGGEIASGKGVNVPGGLASRPILEDADQKIITLGLELQVDLLGVSYVRTPNDIRTVRAEIRKRGGNTPLVAKIETGIALDHLDAILARTDAVMIARGDLSLEIPYERVPVEQKRIVRAALRAGRPVITATQMLQSMVHAGRPTRAEANDVANAVLDGTDAVMLSDETAIGSDPVRVCSAMARIIGATEAGSLPRGESPDASQVGEELRELVVFSHAAVRTATELGVTAIVTWSRGGLAARLLARERPSVPILAPTRSEATWRRLALVYGTQPVLCPDGRMTRADLERVLGPVEDRSLLLVVQHRPGEQRRIPWLGLVRVADSEGWAQDPRL